MLFLASSQQCRSLSILYSTVETIQITENYDSCTSGKDLSETHIRS